MLLRGLGSAGAEVILINSLNPSRARRYLECELRALRQASNVDVIVMGARGDYYGQPLSLFRPFLECRVVAFDAVLSLYETFVVDRQYYPIDSTAAWSLHLLDEIALQSSDVVIADTQAHAQYYTSEFRLSRARARTTYIGTDDSVFYPRPRRGRAETFVVGFWGGFIPLQGIENIVRAAKLVSGEPDIAFVLLGHGQTWNGIHSLAKTLNLSNLRFEPDWMSYEELADRVAAFDLCLGVFGANPKALNIIPNKAFETMAMRLPLVTADTPASREVLTNRDNAFLVPVGDPEALADSILELKSNPELRHAIAIAGYSLFKERFTPAAIGRSFLDTLKPFVDSSHD